MLLLPDLVLNSIIVLNTFRILAKQSLVDYKLLVVSNIQNVGNQRYVQEHVSAKIQGYWRVVS